MAGRGRASFQKRQKEQLRLERRQQKAARKEDRKTNKPEGGDPDQDLYISAEDADGLGLLPEGGFVSDEEPKQE